MEYNLFSQNNISFTDETVRELFDLEQEGQELNWVLLENIRTRCLKTWPKEAEQINKDVDDLIYSTKRKLANKGLL